MSNLFKITYSDGSSEDIRDDSATPEEMAAKAFGSVWAEAQERGAKVELVEELVASVPTQSEGGDAGGDNDQN